MTVETFIPNSSNLDEITYDPDEQVLTVQFKSGLKYEYRSVPQATFEGLKNAKSAGSYFHSSVRSVYPYTVV